MLLHMFKLHSFFFQSGIPVWVTLTLEKPVFNYNPGASGKMFQKHFTFVDFEIPLMWALRRNLSAEMDSPWAPEGLYFINNSLAAIFGQWLLMFSTYQEESQTELLASYTMCVLPDYPAESTIVMNSWFYLSPNGIRPA